MDYDDNRKGFFFIFFLAIDTFFCHGLFIMWVGVGWLEDNDDIRYRKNVLLMSKKEKNLAENLDATGSTPSLGIHHHGCGLIPAVRIEGDALGKVFSCEMRISHRRGRCPPRRSPIEVDNTFTLQPSDSGYRSMLWIKERREIDLGNCWWGCSSSQGV